MAATTQAPNAAAPANEDPTGAAGSPTDEQALAANRTVRDELARMEADLAALEAVPVTLEQRVEHAIEKIQESIDDANERGWRDLDNKDGLLKLQAATEAHDMDIGILRAALEGNVKNPEADAKREAIAAFKAENALFLYGKAEIPANGNGAHEGDPERDPDFDEKPAAATFYHGWRKVEEAAVGKALTIEEVKKHVETAGSEAAEYVSIAAANVSEAALEAAGWRYFGVESPVCACGHTHVVEDTETGADGGCSNHSCECAAFKMAPPRLNEPATVYRGPPLSQEIRGALAAEGITYGEPKGKANLCPRVGETYEDFLRALLDNWKSDSEPGRNAIANELCAQGWFPTVKDVPPLPKSEAAAKLEAFVGGVKPDIVGQKPPRHVYGYCSDCKAGISGDIGTTCPGCSGPLEVTDHPKGGITYAFEVEKVKAAGKLTDGGKKPGKGKKAK